MANAIAPEPTIDRLQLFVMRIGAIISMMMLAPMLITFEIFFFLPAVPLIFYNYRLLRRPPAGARKEWLALAVGMAVWTFIVAVLAAIMFLKDQQKGLGMYLGWVALVQAVMVANAIRIYYRIGRENSDLRKLMTGFAKGAIYCIFVLLFPLAIAIPNSLGSGTRANESTVLGNLRSLNTAQATFAETYHSGFSDGLNRLGPPAAGSNADVNHADLVDPILAGLAEGGTNTSLVKNKYRFTYIPGARNAKGMVTSFTIMARPIEYANNGRRSFFTDESGLIRATDEDRPANAQDPPI